MVGRQHQRETVHRKVQVGNVKKYPTQSTAHAAGDALRLTINDRCDHRILGRISGSGQRASGSHRPARNTGVKLQGMEITLETLHKFCQRYAQGGVSFVDSKGATRILKDEEPDAWEPAEKADQFRCLGKGLQQRRVRSADGI
jgi:hypothetical protein